MHSNLDENNLQSIAKSTEYAVIAMYVEPVEGCRDTQEPGIKEDRAKDIQAPLRIVKSARCVQELGYGMLVDAQNR